MTPGRRPAAAKCLRAATWLVANAALLAAASVLGLAAFACPARAAVSPAQELAERYAPALMVEPQARECGPGEAYRPIDIDLVLGRAAVVLRDPARRIVKEGPTAADLFDRPYGYYIDLPGNPLRPGCGYERDYRSWNGDHKPVVYAHLATDANHPGKLAVQYWLYYTFNDAKNKHEGDWEMAQVDFSASTAEEALRTAPYQVDLAQHAGGERSDWTDPRVRKDGTHPVIFVATGSHAGYFRAALFLGRSPHEGFGCDSTRHATEPVTTQIVLLPDVPDSASSPFAWLAFHGRWGQLERSINNGPTGPADKEQWLHPIEWANGLRAGSVTVPGTSTLGPTLTNFFCGAVSTTSSALIWGLVHPAPFFVLLALIPFACLAPARRTTWRPANPDPMRARRGGGQIIGAAARLYRRDLRTFLTLGLVFVPVAVLAAAVQWVLFHLTGLSSFVALDGKQGAVTILFTVMIGDIGAAFAAVLATAAVAVVLQEETGGRRISAKQAARTVRARLRPLAAATLIQYGVVLLMTLTVVGIPLAIDRFIRWSLFAQACMLDGRDGRAALARSSRLVRGHWWRTFGFTVLVSMLAVVSGLSFGIALLLLTSQTLNFIDLASSLIYVLTVPFTAAALTLYYFDLEAQESAEVAWAEGAAPQASPAGGSALA
ncbi:MAG: hypothetical protein JO027_04205 [Solirubrobacterales bacterium]|nr:hypothetical protein [Solirubrobacterales bacterium]